MWYKTKTGTTINLNNIAFIAKNNQDDDNKEYVIVFVTGGVKKYITHDEHVSILNRLGLWANAD